MSYDLEKLSDEIDHNFGNILSSIIIGYYSKYTFDSDAQTKRLNNFVGFSPRINRKHRLGNIDLQEEINIKKTYLLAQSYIELTCYEIDNYLQEEFHYKTKSDDDFLRCILNQTKIKNYLNNIGLEYIEPRYSDIVNFVSLSAHVIKHTSGIIKNVKSGAKLIKQYKLIEGQKVYCKRVLNKIAVDYSISCYCAEHLLYNFICMIYVFFKDILYMISKDSQFKIPSLDISKITTQLVEIELQDNIGDILVSNLENGAILAGAKDPIRKLSDKNINDYIDIKIQILEDLYAQNPDYLVQYECRNNQQQLQYEINQKLNKKLSKILKNVTQNSKPINQLNYCNTSNLNGFLKKMINLYEEDIVMKMYFNDYQGLDNSHIAQYIIDFYKNIASLEKIQKGKIVRSLGMIPFRKWDPFSFMQNRFIYFNDKII